MMMRGLLGLLPTPAPVRHFQNVNVHIRNAKQEKLYQEWKNHVVNLLIVTQTGIDIKKLGQTLLNYGCGDGFVPIKQMGFETFGEFLYSFRDSFHVTHFPNQNPNDPRTRLFLFINHHTTFMGMNRDVADVCNLVQHQRKFDGNWNHPTVAQVMLCHPHVVQERLMAPKRDRNLVWMNPNLVTSENSRVVEIEEIRSTPDVIVKNTQVAVQASPTVVETSPVSIPVVHSQKIHDGDDKKGEKMIKTVDCGVNTSPQKRQEEPEVAQGVDQNDGGGGDATSLMRRSLFSRLHPNPNQSVTDLFYRLPVPDRYIRYVGPTSGSCTTCNMRLEKSKKKEDGMIPPVATPEFEEEVDKKGGSTDNLQMGSTSLSLQELKMSQEETVVVPKEAPMTASAFGYADTDSYTSQAPGEEGRVARVVIDPDFTVEDEEGIINSRIARQTFKRCLPTKRTTFNTGKSTSQVFLDTLIPDSNSQFPILSNDTFRPVVSSTPKVPQGQKSDQVKRLNFNQL